MSTGIPIDAALASGWFGAGLPETTRTRLVELAELTSMPAGAIALREGSPVDSLGGRGRPPRDPAGGPGPRRGDRADGRTRRLHRLVRPRAAVSCDVDGRRDRTDDPRVLRRTRAEGRDGCRSGACRGCPAARAGRRVTAPHCDPDAAARPLHQNGPGTMVIPTQDAGQQDATRWLPFDDLDRLLEALRADGRTIIGPVVRDEAIILDEITSADDLPAGRGAETAPGRYRLTRREDARRFDHAVGPMSPKRWTFPPRAPIRVGKRTASGVRFTGSERILRPSRSSACGPVSWPPSASRIASCSTARRSTATIAHAAPRPSSSPWNARHRPRPASARPWARGRR